jgi:hypothetical protein
VDAGTPTLLGIAAIISSISGALTTVFGARAARKEATARAEDECREKLKAARLEAEDAAKELHDVKMRDYRES